MYRITWPVGTVISVTLLAGFVFEISWMDIERQSELQMVNLMIDIGGFIFVRGLIIFLLPILS